MSGKKGARKLITERDAKRIRKMAETDAVGAVKELRATIALRSGVKAARKFSIDAITNTSKRKTPVHRTGSYDQEFQSDFQRKTLIATGRDIFQNFSFAQGMVETHVKNVIGPGPRLQLTTDDDAFNERGERYWNGRKNRLDVAGKSFAQNLRIGERREVEDGDYGIMFVKGGQVQYIEADRIADPPGKTRVTRGHTINGGVERFASSEIMQYHIYNRGKHAGSMKYKKAVPKEDFILCADMKRFDQSRGACWVTAAINDLRDLQETLDAAKGKWKIDNMLGVAVESDMPDGAGLASLWGAMTDFAGTDSKGNTQTKYEIKLADGIHSFELAPGDKIKSIKSETPNNTFEPMTILLIRIVALTMNMPLEIALQFFTRGSYAAVRASFLQYWAAIIMRRSAIEENNIDRLVFWQLSRAIKSGELQGPDKKLQMKEWEWQWPGFPILDPDKRRRGDMAGYKLAVESLSDITGRDGKFWQDVAAQRVKEIKWITELAVRENVDPALVLPIVADPGQLLPGDENDDDGTEANS